MNWAGRTIAIFMGCLFCLGPSAGFTETLVIGSIGDKPVEEIRLFFPFAKYLETQLGAEGIRQVDVVVVRSIPEMAERIRTGDIDLYIDSPYPSMAVNALAKSKMLLRRWKDGIAHYHSVIFTRKGQGIQSISDLNGHRVAFEEPFSSSSYFFPKNHLLGEGLEVVEKSSPFTPVDSDEVGYIFTQDDENSMVWLLKGKVDAAAMNHASYKKYAGDRIDSLVILARTFDIPRHIVNFRGDLPAPLVNRIKHALINMHASAGGQAVLAGFENTFRFDEIPDQTMAVLTRGQAVLDQEIENLQP